MSGLNFKYFITLFMLLSVINTGFAKQGDLVNPALQTGDSILITQLKNVLITLQQTSKKFKDLGISSGADDHISISCDGKKYEICFRSQDVTGEIYFSKLQDFAVHNGYDIKITESTGTPVRGNPLLLPTLFFKVKDTENAYELVRAIMLNVFRNKKDAYYQLIMPD